MLFEDFKKSVIVLCDENANSLRRKYIDTFINVDHPHFIRYISHLERFSDGYCYTGYLWDCLISPTVIDFDYFKTVTFSTDVFVLWDIHSKEKIFVENYWKFNKSDVLKLNYDVLLNNLEYLPEDIYIFDETFSWTLILTHEENIPKVRLCAKCGKV